MKKFAVVAGVAYILAWIIGLVIASGGPEPDDPATKVASYFAQHEYSALLGHLFVDGIAGLALIALAVVIRRFVGANDPRWRSSVSSRAGRCRNVTRAVRARRDLHLRRRPRRESDDSS